MTSRILYTMGSREKTLLSVDDNNVGRPSLLGFHQRPAAARVSTRQASNQTISALCGSTLSSNSFRKFNSEKTEVSGISSKVETMPPPFLPTRSSPQINVDGRNVHHFALPKLAALPFQQELPHTSLTTAGAPSLQLFGGVAVQCSNGKTAVEKTVSTCKTRLIEKTTFDQEQDEYCCQMGKIIQFARTDAGKNLHLPQESDAFDQMRANAYDYIDSFLCSEPANTVTNDKLVFRADVVEVSIRAFREIVIDVPSLAPDARSGTPSFSSLQKGVRPSLPTTTSIDKLDGPTNSSDVGDDDAETVQYWEKYRSVVYDLFIKFLTHSFVSDKAIRMHITTSFIECFLQRFYTDKEEELVAAKDTLHRLYAVATSKRRELRERMNSLLLLATYDNAYCPGVREVLEVYGAIISGFVKPLKSEHVSLLVRVLLPMPKSSSFLSFNERWLANVLIFFERDQELAKPVLDALLMYWPRQDGQKQVVFACMLEEILDQTPPHTIVQFAGRLFALIARCIRSQHLALVERVLLLFGNDYFMQVFQNEAATMMPLFFREVYRAIMEHKHEQIERRRRISLSSSAVAKKTRCLNNVASSYSWSDWDILVLKFDKFLSKIESLAPALYSKCAHNSGPSDALSPSSLIRSLSVECDQGKDENGGERNDAEHMQPRGATKSATTVIAAPKINDDARRTAMWRRIEHDGQFPFHGSLHEISTPNTVTTSGLIVATKRRLPFRWYYHHHEMASGINNGMSAQSSPDTKRKKLVKVNGVPDAATAQHNCPQPVSAGLIKNGKPEAPINSQTKTPAVSYVSINGGLQRGDADGLSKVNSVAAAVQDVAGNKINQFNAIADNFDGKPGEGLQTAFGAVGSSDLNTFKAGVAFSAKAPGQPLYNGDW